MHGERNSFLLREVHAFCLTDGKQLIYGSRKQFFSTHSICLFFFHYRYNLDVLGFCLGMFENVLGVLGTFGFFLWHLVQFRTFWNVLRCFGMFWDNLHSCPIGEGRLGRLSITDGWLYPEFQAETGWGTVCCFFFSRKSTR